MRKKIFIMILFLISTELFSQSPQQLIKQANDFYIKQNYDKALQTYLKVLKKDYTSPELLYNIANSYFRLNKLGFAILYYEKALRMAPNDEDIQSNLRLARAKTLDKIEEFPKIFLTVWWDSLVSFLSFSAWSIVLLFLFWLLLLALGMYLISNNLRLRRIGFYSSSILFALLIFIAVICYESYKIQTNPNEGILITESEVVKQAPDIQSNDAFIIHEGIKFTVEDKVNNWVKIKLIDGKVGWIPTAVFRII